ncbi:hypothetical protein T440DRAFT_455693 [Plenodomus tracheiphilus IPT5]|uniref:Uncharacterized protein n=1 Tax=Plenodomus tracheiphilus IPT5 TaxID=1408161 RepID=A0A6A7AX40_9PLEO|nr:hypothetical protein T440DRAFT_455693 [Plenodomus tracheiphilus IPT5]
MPPPEAQLLADLLLAPAPLQDFTTLRQFTDIFPRSHRESPGVPQLYGELQRLRDKDMDAVRRDIAVEVKRSKPLRHEYARERRPLDGAAMPGRDAVALQMEDELSGTPRKTRHTLETAHACIHDACHSLELQLAEMDEANAKALDEVRELVGSLSDLRHGRFSQAVSGDDVGGEVLATLRRLEAVCTGPTG